MMAPDNMQLACYSFQDDTKKNYGYSKGLNQSFLPVSQCI